MIHTDLIPNCICVCNLSVIVTYVVATNDCTFLPKMAINGMICNSIENVSHIFAISGDILLPQVATNGNYLLYDRSCHKWLHTIAKNGNKRNDLQLYGELKSLSCHFWQYFAFLSCHKWQLLVLWQQLLALWQKLPKMAINGCILLPIKGTIYNSIEYLSHLFAISGNILLP